MRNLILIALILLILLVTSACFATNYGAKTSAGNTITDKLADSTKNHAVQISAKKNVANKSAETTVVSKSIVINHTSIKLDQIPAKWIEKAKKDLHIAYWHTSHGSQIISGLLGLTEFKKAPYIYKKGIPEGSLDLRDNPPSGASQDLGNKAWAQVTRKYLEKNKDINVVMWSWCGQLSKVSTGQVKTYLDLMQELQKEYPKITFVYMTGHLDGTGEKKTLAKNNKQIREFCIKNDKVLYDFVDIESYNPEGVYFGDKYVNDACEYDSDGDGKTDKNWAKEWQATHKIGVDWYQCSAAHSQSVNANMKAYAAWWLMARIAGWDGIPTVTPNDDNVK